MAGMGHSVTSPGGGKSPGKLAICEKWGKNPMEQFARSGGSLTIRWLEIDKAFRIAKPMRKAAWTKRFAAGWGERGPSNGPGSSGRGRFWEPGRVWAGTKHDLCAERLRSRALVGSKRRRRISQSAFQANSVSELRPPETRIFSEKARPATPAVGTARQGRVMVGPLVAGLIARFDELAQRIAEA